MKFDPKLGKVSAWQDDNRPAPARVIRQKVICKACGRDTALERQALGVAFGRAATLMLDAAGVCQSECYIRLNRGVLPNECIRLLRQALRSPKSFPVFVDDSGSLLIESSPVLEMIQRIETARRELRAKGCLKY
jgi:hypothetical protein